LTIRRASAFPSACHLQTERRGFYGEIRQSGIEARRIGDAPPQTRNTQERQGREGRQREEPQAGDRDRSERSEREGREGAAEIDGLQTCRIALTQRPQEVAM